MVKKYQKGKWYSINGISVVKMQTLNYFTVVRCIFQGAEESSSAKTCVILPKILENPFSVAEARRFKQKVQDC